MESLSSSSNPTSNYQTRLSLIHRASIDNDTVAWTDLLKQYHPFIRKVAFDLGFQPKDIDDLEQEVSLKLWKGLKTYKPREGIRFRAWLSRLIRNAATDFVKARSRESGFTASAVPDWIPENSVTAINDIEQRIEEEWKRHVVGHALQKLNSLFSGKAVEVLRLSLVGKSPEEIAELLNIRRNSVAVLLHRANRRLEQEINAIRRDLELGGEGS